jgi:hypothetical protein
VATVPTFPPGDALQQSDLLFLLDQPGGGVYQATPQAALTSSVTTVITWDTLWWQNDPTVWASGSRLTVNTPGRYLIVANLRWTSNSTGYRFIDIRKNAGGSGSGGSAVSTDVRPAVNGNATTHSASVILPGLVAGDYLELFGFQSSGGGLQFNTGSLWGCASLSVQRVGS